jgi:hypothetical protein
MIAFYPIAFLPISYSGVVADLDSAGLIKYKVQNACSLSSSFSFAFNFPFTYGLTTQDSYSSQIETNLVFDEVCNFETSINRLCSETHIDEVEFTDTFTRWLTYYTYELTTFTGSVSVTYDYTAAVYSKHKISFRELITFIHECFSQENLEANDTFSVERNQLLRMAEYIALSVGIFSTLETPATTDESFSLQDALCFVASALLGESVEFSDLAVADLVNVVILSELLTVINKVVKSTEVPVLAEEEITLLSLFYLPWLCNGVESVVLNDFATQFLVYILEATSQLTLTNSDNILGTWLPLASSTLQVTEQNTSQLSALIREQNGLLFFSGLDFPDGEGKYYAWVMNTDSLGITQYTNFPFNSLTIWRGKALGLSETGLYELIGDDDDGTAIDVLVRTGDLDFGTSYHKNIIRAYLYLTSDDDFYIKTISTHRGKRNETWYKLESRLNEDDAQTRRVRFGRGNRGTTWAFELSNVGGADFALEKAEVMPVVLSRRV